MADINVIKRGSKWQYRFEGASINGKRKQYSKSGFNTKKEALEAGAKALVSLQGSARRQRMRRPRLHPAHRELRGHL